MLPLLTLAAVVVGVVCGYLYSFLAVLLTGPLLALVCFVAAETRGWGFGPALLIGAGSLAISQLAFLGGVRLRAAHYHRQQRGHTGERRSVGQQRATPTENTH